MEYFGFRDATRHRVYRVMDKKMEATVQGLGI